MELTTIAVEKLIEGFIWMLFTFISVFIILIAFFYFSRKKIVQIELEKQQLLIDNQNKVLQSIITTQEEERQRIAQDLHDAVSSKLNIISLQLYTLQKDNLNSEEKVEIRKNSYSMVKNVLEQSRNIAHQLLPPVLEKFGLQAAVEELIYEYISTNKNWEIKYTFNWTETGFSKTEELHIFRIIQELFNNTLKYASATTICLNFENTTTGKQLIYSDNGKGINSNILKSKKGIGLFNIESRTKILNGQIKITTEENKGFKIKINW